MTTMAQLAKRDILDDIALFLEERNHMNKTIGHLNGNWKNGNRRSLDDTPFELSPLQLLQIDLDVAHQFIRQGTPAMIEIGKQKVAEVVERVTAMIATEKTVS